MSLPLTLARAAPRIRPRLAVGGLAAALLLGLAVRLPTLSYGLPALYYGDERYLFLPALRIAQTGDLNPTRLDYGSLFIYILATVDWLAARAGLLPPLAELPLLAPGGTYYPVPQVVLLARVVSVLFSLVAVVGVFLVSRRLLNERVAALAATLLAVSPLSVLMARYAVADAPLQALTIFALWAILRLYEDVTWPRAILAGVLVGLSASAKYPGILLVLPLVVAGLLARRRTHGLPPTGGALVAAALAFVATTPYAVLDATTFQIFAARIGGEHLTKTVTYAEGHSAVWYVRHLLTQGERGLVVPGFIGFLIFAWRRPREASVVGLFPLALFALMNNGGGRTLRYLLPILAVLAVFADYALVALVEALPPRRRWLGWLAAGACLAMLFGSTWLDIQTLRQPDSRALAAAWAQKNAVGAPLFSDDMALTDDPRRPPIARTTTVVEHPATWYAERGYLVFASDFRRTDPNRTLEQEALWAAFEADPALELVAHLDGHMWGVPGYGVRIYRPRTP